MISDKRDKRSRVGYGYGYGWVIASVGLEQRR